MSRAIEEVAVVLSGDQTVGGIKTFTSSPIAPTPVSGDNSTKVATTAFVNTKVSATVQTTGDQTVAGTKTFSDGLVAPTVVNTDNSTKVATTAHVKDYVTNKAIKPTNFADAPATLSTNYVLVWDSVSGEYRKTTIASIASGGVTLAPVATSGVYSDLTGRPTLGTASTLDVGTTANKVVQLDSTAKLPAVDGSQLTGMLLQKLFTSADQTFSNGTLLTLAHGLAVAPKVVTFKLKCTTADLSYSVNDVIELGSSPFADNSVPYFSVYSDATNIYVKQYGLITSHIALLNKSTGASAIATAASWRFIVQALA